MIGRAAQRDRRPGLHQPGQQEVEPHRVFGGEPAGEQVLAAVVVGELGLYAGHVVGLTRERGDDPAQLQRIGLVLGVVDGDDLTGREMQAVVARLGFGARLRGGHQDHRHDLAARHGDRVLRGLHGAVVVLLEQQQHLQLLARVFERGHARDEVVDHLGLVVRGHEDRVGGQFVVRNRPGVLVGDSDDGLPVEPAGEDDQTVDHGGDVRERAHRDQHREGADREEHRAAHDQRRHRERQVALPRHERDRGRRERMPLPQAVDGVVQRRGLELVGDGGRTVGAHASSAFHWASTSCVPTTASMSRSLYSELSSTVTALPRIRTLNVLVTSDAIEGVGRGKIASGR